MVVYLPSALEAKVEILKSILGSVALRCVKRILYTSSATSREAT